MRVGGWYWRCMKYSLAFFFSFSAAYLTIQVNKIRFFPLDLIIWTILLNIPSSHWIENDFFSIIFYLHASDFFSFINQQNTPKLRKSFALILIFSNQIDYQCFILLFCVINSIFITWDEFGNKQTTAIYYRLSAIIVLFPRLPEINSKWIKEKFKKKKQIVILCHHFACKIRSINITM